MKLNDKLYDIRPAELSDCPIINKLASQIWEPAYGQILSLEQLKFMFQWMYSIDSLENQIKSGHHFFIAYHQEKPVGYMSIEKENDHRYHLQKIYVLPSEQGQGLGRILIKYAENQIKTWEAGRKEELTFALNVNRQNQARYFYEKIGFIIESEGDFDIGHGFFMNDYIMVKKIIIE